MSVEHPKTGRRSRGEAIHLQRAAAAANKAGKSFIRPELPGYITPEDRLDFDRFILPALQKLPEETVKQVNQKPGIVQDYVNSQWEIYRGKNEEEVMTEFRTQHPASGRANMEIMTNLTPAFNLIKARFRQAKNASSLQFGRNWLNGHPHRWDTK